MPLNQDWPRDFLPGLRFFADETNRQRHES